MTPSPPVISVPMVLRARLSFRRSPAVARVADAFGDTRLDVLRAQAYLDLLNGVTAETRIACAEPQDDAADAAEALAWAETRAAARYGATRGVKHEPGDDESGGDDRRR